MDDPYSLKSLQEKAENEEELALLSILMCRGMEYLQHTLDKGVDDEIPLFCDLEFAKQCGNQAFAKKNWMSALGYYTKLLEHAYQLKAKDSHNIPITAVEELFVVVHANLAQVLIHLGRNDEAIDQCQSALKMHVLFNKPALHLHKKVLHRLKLASGKPSAEALLAAEECRAQLSLYPPMLIAEDTKISSYKVEESDREAAEYAFQLVQGDYILADSIRDLCSGRSGIKLDVEMTLSMARSSALKEGMTARIEKQQIVRLMKWCDRGKGMSKQRKEQEMAKKQFPILLEKVMEECEETVYNACLREDPSMTEAILSERKGWLRSYDPVSAISYFLCAADDIAGAGDDLNVSKNSKAYQKGKEGAVYNLRTMVEMTWWLYAEALSTFDMLEHGKTDGPSWLSVEFERARCGSRMMKGMNKPLIESPYSTMIGCNLAEDTPSSSEPVNMTATTTEYVPSLQDLARQKIKRELQLAAVRSGLEKLRKEKERNEDFDADRYVVSESLKWQVANMKETLGGDVFPIVDDVWHLCLLGPPTDLGFEMMKLLSFDHIKEIRPPCLFLSNRCFGMRDVVQTIPQKGVIAVEHLPDDLRRNSSRQIYCVEKLVLKAIESRQGIPKHIIIGPTGCMVLSDDYLNYCGTHKGGRPTEQNEFVDEKGYGKRSEMEAFFEDELGIQEQSIMGIFDDVPGTYHEERPKEKTPAQYRLNLWLEYGRHQTFESDANDHDHYSDEEEESYCSGDEEESYCSREEEEFELFRS